MKPGEIAADQIVPVAYHKGVGIFPGQREERMATVRVEIDEVAAADDPVALFEFCKRVDRSPESRLFAGAKLRAFISQLGHQRMKAGITLQLVDAWTSGLSCSRWQDRWSYCSLLDPILPGGPQPVPREVPLAD